MNRTFAAAAVLAALALAAATGGCSRTREAFGLTKSAPDEFAVVTRAPLSVPPDFGLRPPAPGAERPQERTVQQDARQVLMQSGGTAPRAAAPGEPSRGETALLGRAGARDVSPKIRETVDRENAILAAEDDRFIDRLIFWQEDRPPGTALDAEAEAQRLRDNAAQGEAPTKGATPVIERYERGFLEGLFN